MKSLPIIIKPFALCINNNFKIKKRFVHPGHEHNVMGYDRLHLHEHIACCFDDFLK